MSKSNLRPVYRNDEDYLAAQNRSREIFGKVNFSMYVNMLIEKDLRKEESITVVERGMPQINSIAERQALTRSITKWVSIKEFKENSEEVVSKIVNEILEEMK